MKYRTAKCRTVPAAFILAAGIILAACSSVAGTGDGQTAGKTSVTFATSSSARTIITGVSLEDYTYTLKGTLSGGTEQTLFSGKSYSEFTAAGALVLDSGTWSFTLDAYSGGVRILTGTQTADLSSGAATVTFTLYAVTGGTGTVNVTLRYPSGKGVTAVKCAVYDSPSAPDTGSSLPITPGSPYDSVFFSSQVPSAAAEYVRFFLYDAGNTCIGVYTEAVYAVTGCTASVTRTLADIAPTGPVLESSLPSSAASTTGSTYTGTVSTPFSGAVIYSPEDNLTFTVTLAHVPGNYRFIISGASSTDGAASFAVSFDGGAVQKMSFTGKAESSVSFEEKIKDATAQHTIKLTCPDDNGTYDVYIEKIEVYYTGAPLGNPVPPEKSVWESGTYRNMFAEYGKTQAEVTEKVNSCYSQLFTSGSDTQKIFYDGPSNSDGNTAYILTTDTNDVRSEGMSYGMMITVQMDDKTRFDKLWNWAHTYMLHKDGDQQGYFAWQLHTDGTIMDGNPAPDGEQYFAMALFFAWKRWGNGTGIYDYEAQADTILDEMVEHKTIHGLASWNDSGNNLINDANKQVIFSCVGNSATYTDPSYHLPAFYELWAKWATSSYYTPSTYWPQVAAASRALWKKALNSSTYLGPDYSGFDGTACGGNHAQYRFDAWRTIMNITNDYYWFRGDAWEKTAAEGLQSFFEGQGVSSYGNQYELSGTVLSEGKGSHSSGLVAMNAIPSLVSSSSDAWDFIDDFWNMPLETGTYRYWNGCLYMFGMLELSGNYRMSW